MKNSSVMVRRGTREDMPQVLALIQELATYEKAPQEVTVTLEQLTEDGFGPDPIYGLFVAEVSQRVIGMALYYEKYSTWKGRCIYLEDIIVNEQFRGQGIGHLLFRSVIGVAKEKQAARMEWQVLEWNEPAIRFYRKYHADLDGEWLNGRLTKEQIQAFK